MAKKVVNFNDFNREIEKSDLQDTSRGFSKNTNDGQQVVGNQKMVYNKVTRKWDNVTKDMIDDQIEEIEKTNEEYFGGAEGVAIIELGGQGEVKDYVENAIKKALKNIGGEIHLLVDGEEVDIN